MIDDSEGLLHVPRQWENLNLSHYRGLLMIIGAADTGKSTFAQYLLKQLTGQVRSIAFIDGDPGQSRLGPPTTISLSIGGTTRHAFIGSISPSGHMLQMLTGAFKLVHQARAEGADTVIYDTSGLIDPRSGGFNLKLAKIDLLRPRCLFAIQENRELEPLLAPLRIRNITAIEDLHISSAIRRRDISSRRLYRRNRFEHYFSQKGCLHLDLGKIALFPGPALEPNRLVALEDAQGFTLALGIVRTYCRKSSQITLVTPLNSDKGIKALRPGSMLVDPQTFEDRFSR